MSKDLSFVVSRKRYLNLKTRPMCECDSVTKIPCSSFLAKIKILMIYLVSALTSGGARGGGSATPTDLCAPLARFLDDIFFLIQKCVSLCNEMFLS